MRVAVLFAALTAAFTATALAACSSGSHVNGSNGTTKDAGTTALDGTAPQGGDDGSVPVTVEDSGAPPDAISVPPPIDDADTPVTDAGPGGPWIAFASSRTGNFDIYLVHPDGTGLRPIVQAAGTDLAPSWSPDGAQIAFESNSWSDAGDFGIYVVQVASGAIGAVATGLAGAVSPAWSPDGTQLALGGPGGLYTVPVAGGTASPLTSGGFRDNSPAWAPDGGAIYFSSNRESSGGFDVWSVDPDGGALTQVTTNTGILGGPAVSPDGTTIAFAQSGPSATQVVFFTLSTQASTVFTAQGDYEPAFSPSGTELAVTSTRYGADSPDVVVLGIPDASAPFQLTSSAGVNGQAAFQPGQ